MRRFGCLDHYPPHPPLRLDVQAVAHQELFAVFEPGDLSGRVGDFAVEDDGVAGFHPLVAVCVRQRAELCLHSCRSKKPVNPTCLLPEPRPWNFPPTADVERGRVADSVGDEGDLGVVLARLSLMDDQRVLRLALPYGEAPAGLQLGAVQKPGSSRARGQLDGEVSVVALGNLTAVEAVLDLRPGY